MWYVNVGMKVIQANVYDNFFTGGMLDDNVKNELRKAIKQKKNESGQFILKHKDGSANEWTFVNISDEKGKWYLYNEDNTPYSIIHHLRTPGNAWYHNSHSSSNSMYERIFESYRTIQNNTVSIYTEMKKPKPDSRLTEKFNKTNAVLINKLKQNLDSMEQLGLVENPQKLYTLDDVLARKVKIYHYAPVMKDGEVVKVNGQTQTVRKLNEPLYNRLAQIKEHIAKKSSVPREIHSKLSKEEKAKTKQQASATAMETDQPARQTNSARASSPPRPTTRTQSQFSNEPTYW